MAEPSSRVVQACRTLSLFRDIADDTAVAIAGRSILQTVPAGTEVLGQDEAVGYLYGVLSGSVEAVSSFNGLQTLLYLVPASRCFPHSCALIGTRAFAGFVTVSRTEFLMIPVSILNEQLERDGRLALNMARELARTTDLSAREILNQKLRTASERLAALLLREHSKSPDSNVIESMLSKRKLALRLGATPETLSRILGNLKHLGVESDGNRYVINDIDALRAHAKQSPTLDSPPW